MRPAIVSETNPCRAGPDRVDGARRIREDAAAGLSELEPCRRDQGESFLRLLRCLGGKTQLGRDADMMSAVSMMLRSLLPGRVACEGRELVNVVAAP